MIKPKINNFSTQTELLGQLLLNFNFKPYNSESDRKWVMMNTNLGRRTGKNPCHDSQETPVSEGMIEKSRGRAGG